jgi:ABC-type multidrug transport system fused ATPase/permease subunit
MITSGLQGDIVFDQVSFKYEGRKETLFDDLSFYIKEGSKVALVGSSGCGKSTIVQMLLGFYSPSKGKIKIGANNLEDFDLRYLRSHFGVVSQEPHLFNASFK